MYRTREQGVSSESIPRIEYMHLKWISEADHIAFVSGVISKHVGHDIGPRVRCFFFS